MGSLDEQEDESRSSPRSIFSEPGEQSELVFPADDPEEAEPTEFGDHINPGDQNVPDRLKARALLYFEVQAVLGPFLIPCTVRVLYSPA